MPMPIREAIPSMRRAAWLRLVLGHRVLNGLSVGMGLAVLAVLAYLAGGPATAVSASVAMSVPSLGDQVSPARDKLTQIAPRLWAAALMSAALMSAAVEFAQLVPAYSAMLIGAIVCADGFVGMLGTAWGLRGGPLGFALLLSNRVRDVRSAA